MTRDVATGKQTYATFFEGGTSGPIHNIVCASTTRARSRYTPPMHRVYGLYSDERGCAQCLQTVILRCPVILRLSRRVIFYEASCQASYLRRVVKTLFLTDEWTGSKPGGVHIGGRVGSSGPDIHPPHLPRWVGTIKFDQEALRGTPPPDPMHWKAPPGRPANAQPLSPERQVPASVAIVTDSNRPQPLWQPPPTA